MVPFYTKNNHVKKSIPTKLTPKHAHKVTILINNHHTNIKINIFVSINQ